MAKSRKPYPGLGRFVVMLDYGSKWVVHCGANTRERAQAESRKLPQWPASKVAIVENVPGAPEALNLTTYYR